MEIIKQIEQLKKGLSTAFIDQNISSNLAYKPQFVSNNYKEGRKVISSIEDELLACEEFAISVAFITLGGITPLLQTFRELEQRGIPGKILTTDYLTFSDPKALRILANFKNIELKMFVTENAKEGFHTKGYIFKKEEMYRIIVGSSNMTLSALTTNREWNTKIISKKQGEYTQNVVKEFDQLWNAQQSLAFEQFIEVYTNVYTKNKIIQRQKEIEKQAEVLSLEVYRLQPNSMQVCFINNLRKIYETGEDKALLISATGTGKTYASAFAARELEFKKVLFLVHRNQIAKQALKAYRKVFDGKVSMGMVTGKYQDYNADFVFATVQILSKKETLSRYKKEHWDLIIIDEAHHSSADSYKKVMDYFKPKLWLGMTATPDKRDDNLEGRNIYEIFNHQIAYEIRLQNAMEEDLLCPFHYFGITDLEVIADAGKSSEEKVENFRYLTSDERVLNVMKQAEFFGYSGERVKGLIFCSRIDEARELSAKFNKKGWRTIVLSGNDSETVRVAAIERLAGDESEDALDYIISVDIFSEGVDVPEIKNVGNLTVSKSLISPMLGGGSTLNGGEDEKQHYSEIEDIYWKIEELNEYREFLGIIDSYKIVELVLANEGTTFDEDIDVKLHLGKGNIVKKEELPIQGILTIGDFIEMQFTESVFKIRETENIIGYAGYPMMPPRINYKINTPFSQPSAKEEYEESKQKYKDSINQIFCYEIYEKEDEDVLVVHLGYLKHNTKMAFPSVLVFKNVPDTISYEIFSKHTSEMTCGVLKMS